MATWRNLIFHAPVCLPTLSTAAFALRLVFCIQQTIASCGDPILETFRHMYFLGASLTNRRRFFLHKTKITLIRCTAMGKLHIGICYSIQEMTRPGQLVRFQNENGHWEQTATRCSKASIILIASEVISLLGNFMTFSRFFHVPYDLAFLAFQTDFFVLHQT